MKNKTNYYFIIHPLLFAIFPILSLYSHNKAEVFISDTLLPLTIVILTTFFLFLLIDFLIKNTIKTSIFISLFWYMFFSYRHFYILLKSALPIRNIYSGMFVMGLWIFILFAGGFLIFRTKRNLAPLSKLFLIFGIALVFFPAVDIGFYELKTTAALKTPLRTDSFQLEEGRQPEKPNELPDIYYLIFDRYANLPTLKEVYNYDNKNFINNLEEKGFYVALESHCNYPATYLSLASSLNMEYLGEFIKKTNRENFRKTIYTKLLDYKTWRFLKAHGYTFIHFGPYWNAIDKNPYADFNYNRTILPEFSMWLYKNSMAYPFGEMLFGFGFFKEQYLRVLYKFDELAKIPSMKDPTFVFAHFALPHEPQVFDKNGNLQTGLQQMDRTRTENYLNQLIFANHKIENLINSLISKSKTPPIIILQSDEGPRSNFDYKPFPGQDELKYHLGILNAYFLPGINKNVLYQSISPVNTFRVIFNQYFGCHLKLLPDKSYLYKHHSFIDVTDGGTQ